MPDHTTILGGSWYIPPTAQDWTNLDATHVKRMLIGFDLARTHPDVLDQLRARGISVLIRMRDEEFRQTPFSTTLEVLDQAQQHVAVTDFIFFNEPEGEYRLDQASPTWGNQPTPEYPHDGGKVYYYRARAAEFIQAYNAHYPPVLNERGQRVGRRGPALVAGAYTNRYKGPTEQPWPGLMMWNRIMYDVLAECDKFTAHIYTEGYKGPVDLERLQYGAQIACSMGRPPYILDEFGILKKPEREQVTGMVEFCRYLLKPETNEPGGIGTQVEIVIPFTWAGDPQGGRAWPASYLLTDPESYRLLGQFVLNG